MVRKFLEFLWVSIVHCFRAATIIIALPVVFSLVLPIGLRPLNLYFDLRETVVEWGKIAHLVIKKPNKLEFKISYSDSMPLQDNHELSWPGESGYSDMWFVVQNPEKDEGTSYKDVRVYIAFDEPNANKVSIKQQLEGWIMFKEGHFNYESIPQILPGAYQRMPRLQIRFLAKGDYPFHYFLYAEGYKRTSGSRVISVK